MVETLKKFAFKKLIESPELKLAEYKGKDIVHKIFETITKEKDGHMLLPGDYRKLFLGFENNETERKRAVCDFIAGMTDKYAIEFYNRLFGNGSETVFKAV